MNSTTGKYYLSTLSPIIWRHLTQQKVYVWVKIPLMVTEHMQFFFLFVCLFFVLCFLLTFSENFPYDSAVWTGTTGSVSYSSKWTLTLEMLRPYSRTILMKVVNKKSSSFSAIKVCQENDRKLVFPLYCFEFNQNVRAFLSILRKYRAGNNVCFVWKIIGHRKLTASIDFQQHGFRPIITRHFKTNFF